MKKFILASIILVASQNVMAWELSNASDASKKVDEGVKTAEEVKAKKDNVEKKGLTDSAKVVAKESAKGAINGAAQGALEGKTIDLGTKGGISGAKKGWGSL